jgi:hypothetical protein
MMAVFTSSKFRADMAHLACFCAWAIAASSTPETGAGVDMSELSGGTAGLAKLAAGMLGGTGATAGVGLCAVANVGGPAAGGGADR